jgi:hypothetical protein
VGTDNNEDMENHVFLEMLDKNITINNKKIKSDQNLTQKPKNQLTRIIKEEVASD